MSKSCHEAIELMNLYLDGRLSGGQYQELAKHLAECEHCRKRMNYLRVISSEIRSDRPAVPADLHNSIMRYIDQANAPAPEPAPKKKRKPLILAACAAALVLVLVGSFALKSLNTPGDASSPDTAKTDTWFGGILKFFGLNKDEEPDDPDKDPDTDKPDTDKPDADKPDTDKPDADKPDDPDKDKPGSDKTEGTYTVPALRTKERFAQYIVATGTVTDLQTYFGLESVTVYPADGSIYICLPNGAGALADVYNSIRNMGLTLHLSPKGLPATDENAPEILFVIFPK